MSVDSASLRDVFRGQFGHEPQFVAEAPGRVNLIGEHTDYNAGFALPVAIDRTVAVAAAPAEGKTVRVYSADFDAWDEWRADAPRRTGRREWRDYVRGVAWALLDGGHSLRSADLVMAGDVPLGAGLSSSAALEVAVAAALCAVSDSEVEPRRLALLCQKAENQFVGVRCGIMDQFAAACSREGHALLIDCRSLEMEQVPLPDDTAIVVVDSKVTRVLGETAYNRRRTECSEAERLLKVQALREVSPERLEGERLYLPGLLYRRARHVVTENARVVETVEALRIGDLSRIGKLMRDSHTSLRDDFAVSTPELDLLVELAFRAEGVIGARMTGAGFGGCTVNLVERNAAGRFEADVVEPYREKTGLAAAVFVCRTVDGLRVSASGDAADKA